MGKSTDPDSYNPEYYEVLRSLGHGENGTLRVTYPNKAEAYRVQMDFYGFKKAIRLAYAGTPDAQLEEYRLQAARLSMRLEMVLGTGEYDLIFSSALSSMGNSPLSRALSGRTIPSVTPSDSTGGAHSENSARETKVSPTQDEVLISMGMIAGGSLDEDGE